MDTGLRARQRARQRERKRRQRRNLAIFFGSIVLLIVFISIFKSCGAPTSNEPTVSPEASPEATVTPTPTPVPETVDEIIAQMSLDEKILQLMVVDIDRFTGVENTTLYGATSQAKVTENPVGGLIYDQGNIESKSQVSIMLQNTQKQYTKENFIPVFLGTTETAGDISEFAKTESFDAAYDAGKNIGLGLKGTGFNLNLSPYIALEQDEDSENVASAAASVGSGMRDGGVIPVYNKFPQEKVLSTTKEAALQKELLPFSLVIQGGADAIMLSDRPVFILTGSSAPYLTASFISETLRGEMDFDGVIFTPPLTGLTGDTFISSLLAGCDILYLPDDYKTALNSIKNAVASGILTEDRITESVRRVLLLKKSL